MTAPRPPLLTRAFVSAAIAHAMLNIAAFLFLHLPGYLQQLGAGESQIGRIMAAQAAGAVLAWPLIGRVIDAHGRRAVARAGVALFIGVIGLYLTVDSLGPGIYLVRLLDGAAQTMWYTALFTFAADLVPVERRTEGLALFGISGLLPIGLGAQAGDLILASATYRELFLFSLGFATAGLVLSLGLRDVLPAGASVEPPRGLLVTAGERVLVPLWFAAAAFFSAVVVLFSFMKTFVTATGTGTVGGFFLAYAGTAVALRLFLGWLPDRLGPRRMLGAAMSSYAAGFVMLALADAPWHVFAAGVLLGAGHGYTFPVLLSLVVARAPVHERGAATAFFTMLDWLALLVAAPTVGYVIERAGYTVAFSSVALLLGGGAVLFYALDRQPGAVPGRSVQ